MTVKEILGNDLDILKEAGLSRDEIISIAKVRKPKIVKKKLEIENASYANERERVRATSLLKDDANVDAQITERFNPLNPNGTPKKIDKSDPAYAGWRREQEANIQARTDAENVEYLKKKNVFDNEQSFLDRVERGATVMGAELYNIGNYLAGNKVDPIYAKVVEDGRARDKEYKETLQSDERKLSVKKLEEGFEKADDAWSTTQAGAKLLYDTVTNPKEWNMGGVVGELANPVNLVGLGSGAVAGKFGTTLLSKTALGAGTGAATQGTLNAGYMYSDAKSLGKSDQEAKKAAIVGGMVGAGMGAGLGGFAGARVKLTIKANLKEKHKENYTKEYEEILDNELMQLDEVDAVAERSKPIIEGLSAKAKSPQELNQLVMHYLPPTFKEEAMTLTINSNQPVSSRLVGGRVRNALVKSIENPSRTPEQLMLVLKKEGFTDETAGVITQAYVTKDVTLYDGFVANKMSEVIDTYIIEKKKQEYQYAGTRNQEEVRGGDVTRREGGANEIPNSVRGNDEPNAEQTVVSTSEPRDAETLPSAKRDIGESGEATRIPKSDERVGGYQTLDADGTGVSRVAEDGVVSTENRVGDDGGVDPKIEKRLNHFREKKRLLEVKKKDMYSDPLLKVEYEKEMSQINNYLKSVEGLAKQNKIDKGWGGVEGNSRAKEIKKAFETVRDETRGENSHSQGDEPQGSSGSGEIQGPKTKGERKAINQQVEEIIRKPIEETTPADRVVLENYTGKGGLESGTKESLTQYYTAPETIDAMYNALDDAGVLINTALEPAVGSGNFLKNRKDIKFTTVDIDKINHEVVKRLYDGDHRHSGYEAFTPQDKFDLVISNVPFSEERGAGRLAHRPDVKALHDHFFIKALEDVKDNGVVAFITSKGVMDKADSKIRKEITASADVIGAYRLPSSAFKHTHTDVISDVIFLQKRPVLAKSRMQKTNELFENSTKDDGGYMSDYFRNFPDRVLGKVEKGIDPMYGKPTYLVTGKPDYSKMKISYKTYDVESQNKHILDSSNTLAPTKAVKSNATRNKKSKNELKTELLEKIKANKRVEDVELYRKTYGKHPLDDKGLKSYHQEDMDNLYELGSYFDKEFSPAESFYSKTRHKGSGKVEVTEKSPLKERLIFNEDAQGIINTSNMRYIKEDDVVLLQNGYALMDGGKVQNEVLYYSGNVYDKIDKAKALLEKVQKSTFAEKFEAKVQEQVKKLEKALPKRKEIDSILIDGHESWVRDAGIEIYRLKLKELEVKQGEGSRIVREWRSEFGKTFDNYLNGKKLIVSKEGESEIAYRRRLREAESEVKDTLVEIKQRALKYKDEIEDVYNRKFNFYKAPDYKQLEYMIEDALAELPEGFSLRETQKKFIIKALYEGKNINAHDVGGGKTFAGIVLGRILKQKGIAKKPMYVVPSKVIKNWEKEILELYPDAKIANLGNLNKSTRTKKLFALSQQNADFVLISQEGFKELKLPADKERAYASQLLRENMRNDDLKGRAKVIQEKRVAMYLKTLENANEDKRITIDKLGVDAIIADEARAFKNVGVRSSLVRMGLGKSFGLSISEGGKMSLDSALAYDFRFKTKYISEMNNNRNVYMLDATPTPNKPLELFTMLKHLDDKIFDEYNIRTDEDFVKQFLEVGQVQDRNGKFKDSITGIKNVFELRGIMDRYIDRISMQEFKDKGYIDIPESKTYKHIIESSDESEIVFDDIRTRLAEAKNDANKRKDVLGIYSNGVSASVDPRLYQNYPIQELAYRTKENNKIDAVVALVAEAKAKDKEAGQIIFVDSAGHSAEHLPDNLHQEIKAKLVEQGGYTKEQVAIISGQEITVGGKEIKASGNRLAEIKQDIVNDYNAGKVKVVIGTTKSAGEGMNIQKYTKDIYHLDLPWTPAEITQRNGRGVRYGNKYKEVNIHYMFTQGSFDDLMFSTVTKKQGWNDLIWDAEAQSHLKIADSDGGGLPSADDIFLSMEKDPIKRREMELQKEHERLENTLFDVEDEVRDAGRRHVAAMSAMTDVEERIRSINRNIQNQIPDIESLRKLEQQAITEPVKFEKKYEKALDERMEYLRGAVKGLEGMLEKRKEKAKMTKDAMETAKGDFVDAEKRLEKFESDYVGDDGRYLVVDEC